MLHFGQPNLELQTGINGNRLITTWIGTSALDRAVDKAYRGRKFDSESERVAFLFDRYEALSNPLGVASSS